MNTQIRGVKSWPLSAKKTLSSFNAVGVLIRSQEIDVQTMKDVLRLERREIKHLDNLIRIQEDDCADHPASDCELQAASEIQPVKKQQRVFGFERAQVLLRCRCCKRREVLQSSSTLGVREFLTSLDRIKSFSVWAHRFSRDNTHLRLVDSDVRARSTREAISIVRARRFKDRTPPRMLARRNR